MPAVVFKGSNRSTVAIYDIMIHEPPLERKETTSNYNRLPVMIHEKTGRQGPESLKPSCHHAPKLCDIRLLHVQLHVD